MGRTEVGVLDVRRATRVLIPLLLLALLFVGATPALAQKATPTPRPERALRARIFWQPERLTVSLTPGETRRIPVKFAASRPIRDAVFGARTVPYLTVGMTPDSWLDIDTGTMSGKTPGRVINATLTLTMAPDAPLGRTMTTIVWIDDGRGALPNYL